RGGGALMRAQPATRRAAPCQRRPALVPALVVFAGRASWPERVENADQDQCHHTVEYDGCHLLRRLDARDFPEGRADPYLANSTHVPPELHDGAQCAVHVGVPCRSLECATLKQ